jgi:hypothetical protein
MKAEGEAKWAEAEEGADRGDPIAARGGGSR